MAQIGRLDCRRMMMIHRVTLAGIREKGKDGRGRSLGA